MLNTSFFTQTENGKATSHYSNKCKMRNNLENVKRVRFNDFSDYDSEKCNNGGKYGFWTDYDRLENGNWKVSYGTTADLAFVLVVMISILTMRNLAGNMSKLQKQSC